MIKKVFGIVALFCVLGGGAWWYLHTSTSVDSSKTIKATYYCDNNKTISAVYHIGEPVPGGGAAGGPPIPTGSVDISLNGASHITLEQTISGSGVRYANADESFVFWNKGRDALILQNNEMDLTYSNCSERTGAE